ncbi:hypothetical_protein [Candidozyma auris]|uniref:hypothetical_protein n=1 Tax=Candidozyma auris TaxID=498019 RepID=UPI000D26D62C|nr:hypothetical_protein [[Candida] auris]QEO20745.1 hypothetical_protein [[Candida] auris]GBL48739.1 hypothetical protein CAJCM15448_10130 [[Candida] auris]
MILSSPQWPDPETVNSLRSRASELSRQFSYGSSASRISTIHSGSKLRNHPTEPSHIRQQSNPFDVLYDPESAKNHPPVTRSKSPLYLDIEKDIHNGQSPNRGYHASNGHPTITVIDDSQLRRGNSVVSTSASLRNRNKIKKRNKMVRKEDLPAGLIVDESASSSEAGYKARKSSKKTQSSRLNFLFPVRRKRSFNYYPIRSQPKFRSPNELDEFYQKHNARNVVRELLPQSMAAYEFTNLISLVPIINVYPDSMRLPLTIPRASNRGNKPDLSVEASPHEARQHSPQRKSLAPPRLQRPEQLTFNENLNFKNKIYKSYKEAIFAGKYSRPPQLQQTHPREAMYVTNNEKEQLETRLLFEILLRRTIAAKIDFRLKQQGYQQRKKRPKEKASDNSLNTSSSSAPSDRPDKHVRDHSHHGRGPKTPRGTKPSNSRQDNTSLLSDPLPSPQISFNANMFEPMYEDSPSSMINWERKFSHLERLSPKRQNQQAFQNLGEQASPSQRFVYNFDKVDLVSKRERSTPNLSNVALYSMQPVNRSEATLSSSESSAEKFQVGQNFHRVSDSTTESKGHSRGSASTNPGNGKRTRDSESTTNTSVLQSLEDLSESVFDYLRSEGAMVYHRYSLEDPGKLAETFNSKCFEPCPSEQSSRILRQPPPEFG